MEGLPLPPGFRFSPLDEELLDYYLKLKLQGKLGEAEKTLIPELDVLSSEPWELMPMKGGARGTQTTDCYAFWARGRKYSQGPRANRCTSRGYWKSTGSDRAVWAGGRKLGMKKTLVFYLGKAPRGEKTDWVMHEYRMDNDSFVPVSTPAFVVCRIFKKILQETGARGGAQAMEAQDESAAVESPQGTLQLCHAAEKTALAALLQACDGPPAAPAAAATPELPRLLKGARPPMEAPPCPADSSSESPSPALEAAQALQATPLPQQSRERPQERATEGDSKNIDTQAYGTALSLFPERNTKVQDTTGAREPQEKTTAAEQSSRVETSIAQGVQLSLVSGPDASIADRPIRPIPSRHGAPQLSVGSERPTMWPEDCRTARPTVQAAGLSAKPELQQAFFPKISLSSFLPLM